MNRSLIFEGCPEGLHWNALSAVDRKDWAMKLINGALAEVLNSGREPDEWESGCLAYAIACLTSGMFAGATVNVSLAATPISERSPDYLPITPIHSLASLFRAFRYASNAPIQAGD